MQREELAAWLRLTSTPGIGNVSARRLLAAFASPQAIFEQGAAALADVATPAQVQALQTVAPAYAAQLALTLSWLDGGSGEPADGVRRRVVTLGDPDYPQALLNIDDPPLLLYLMGQLPPAAATGAAGTATLAGLSSKGIAMVGSRNPTPQGEADARQFARAFSAAGLAVVSGLALGIDGAAHLGALDGAVDDGETVRQWVTVAVVGTGLDRVYPARHRDLAHRITLRGLLVSEYPLGTPPLAENFPRRNRLIAALSLGTLVVEAALKSGSLITARLASEQGKDVFAIPGSIHAAQSRGCHALIKQGAKLVESVQDVLEELRLPAKPVPNTSESIAENDYLTLGLAEKDTENDVLKAMGYDPVGLDALLARTGLDTATLQARLLELELDGQVARLAGGLFQRMAVS